MTRDQLERLIEALGGTILRNDGDAIAGEKIIAQARRIRVNKQPQAGTSTHKIQEADLKVNVLCVIERGFRRANRDRAEPQE